MTMTIAEMEAKLLEMNNSVPVTVGMYGPGDWYVGAWNAIYPRVPFFFAKDVTLEATVWSCYEVFCEWRAAGSPSPLDDPRYHYKCRLPGTETQEMPLLEAR